MRTREQQEARWSSSGAVVSRARRAASPRVPTLPCVVIVDDDPLMRQGVRAALRGLCETVGLDSGEQLEEFLENVRPDLLILDVGLPGRDGFDLCAALRAQPRWRSLPVLFLTARGGIGPYERCLAVRGDAFLTKPVLSEEFVDTVIRLLPPA